MLFCSRSATSSLSGPVKHPPVNTSAERGHRNNGGNISVGIPLCGVVEIVEAQSVF